MDTKLRDCLILNLLPLALHTIPPIPYPRLHHPRHHFLTLARVIAHPTLSINCSSAMAADNYGRRDSAFPNGAQQGYTFHNAESNDDNIRKELYMQQRIVEQSSPIQREAYHSAFSTASTPPQHQHLPSPQPYSRQPASFFDSNFLNMSSAPLPATDYRYHLPPVSDGSSQYGVNLDFGRNAMQGYAETDRSTSDRTSG